MVDDLYKPRMHIYKFLLPQNAYFQQFTQSKYKSQNLDINGFL